MPEKRAELLTQFVEWADAHITGDEKGQAQIFLDRLFQALGHKGCLDVGGTPEFRIRKSKESGGGTAFADYVWKPHVLIEMKKRGTDLNRHYRQAFDYWVRLVPGRPRYAILCNFDEFWVYDFETQMDAPVDKLPLADLPERWGPLAFLFPSHERPVFGNDQEKVTRDAADKLAVCFNKLLVRHVAREQAQRFVLQMLVALFAEDIDLLPRYFVARLLDDCKAPADSFDLLGGLFEAMNTPGGAKGGRFKGVDYFNGGLFAEPARIELYEDELNQLRQAAKEDWSRVRPEIFGTLFEHSLEKEERHAYGGHFTTAGDIMKIVRPTITDPWRNLIENAGTLVQLEKLRQRMLTYRVLDPACGSGNFLYLAYRELKRLEVRLFERIDQKKRTEKGQRQIGHVSASQFYGIDINPFAIEIAKVTMMIARKLAIDELHTIERPLPLDNLDANFIAGDALITPLGEGGDALPTMLFAELETDPFASGNVIPTKWPPADVIIGNPPFLGAKRLKPERGADYVNAVRKTYPAVPGMADYCVYWFRLAHDHLPECTPDDPVAGRAGLVGTQNIRNNKSRVGGLDHIVKTGTIVEAVDNQPWSGEANVHVSIANWVKHAHIQTLPSVPFALPDGRGSDRPVPFALPDGRGSDRQETPPVCDALAYFITYHTYGTWLHGDERGSVDPLHNVFGEPVLDPNTRRQACESTRMRGEPVELDAARRTIVEKTIREVCEFRGWTLHALNVRSNHVHVVVSAPQHPDRVMNDLKSWATRRMVEAGLITKGRKTWARHGSTRYLWKDEDLAGAVRYVSDEQGPDLPCAIPHESLPDGRGSDPSPGGLPDGRGSDCDRSDQSRDREGAIPDASDLRDLLIPAKRRLWYKIDAPKEREKIRRASSVPAHKDYELAFRDTHYINSALSDQTDVSGALPLSCNRKPKRCFQGKIPGYSGFLLDLKDMKSIAGGHCPVVRPYLTGRELLDEFAVDRWVIDFGKMTQFEAASFARAFAYLSSLLK